MNRSEFVKRTTVDAVAVIRLDRPERRNALSQTVIAELSDALDSAKYDPAVRAVVLTGTGSAFCAGMDLKEAVAIGGTAAERAAVSDAQAVADLLMQIHDHPKPIVAGVNGDAMAGGAGLAMACDLVVVAESARIGYPEVKLGLVAAIVMRDLIRLVGERRAKALLLTGEPLSAVEAERWGLVNRVVPASECEEAAITIGRSLAALGPIAVTTTKRLLDETGSGPRNLRGSAAVSAAVRVSDEAVEGMKAFLEKRRPRWSIGDLKNVES